MIQTDGADFSTIARKTLAYLRSRIGFDLWMVTRTEGNDWIVLEAEDHGYGVKPQSTFRWSDSFCSHMVLGHGPRVARSSAKVPIYAAAPIAQQVPIGAYIGVPLVHSDGTLFGTLCAIDPKPQPDAVEGELPLVEMMATLLSGLVAAEINEARMTRQYERAQTDAETDALTGLYNRRAWDRLLAIEDDRCRRYGHPACVIAVDLNYLKSVNDTLGHAAGDELIRRAATVLRNAVRGSDLVARVGGDEFLILGIECNRSEADALLWRVQDDLRREKVSAAAGMATLTPATGLSEAARLADARMYEAKKERA